MEHEAQKFYEQTAPEVFDIIVTMGGYFIKLGQRFGNSRGIIAEHYVHALKPLCTEVPRRPFELMEPVFSAATNLAVREVFENIDTHPLGSASLAQAHRAILRPEYVTKETTMIN